MDETISEKARTLKAKVEKFNKDFAPELLDYVNKTEFPH